MSAYSTTVSTTKHDLRHSEEKADIDPNEDFSCIQCWGPARFTERTNAARFWEFYKIAFKPAYQASAVTRQAFTNLVSTVTKVESSADDEQLVTELALRIVGSIMYHYPPLITPEETAHYLKEVTRETVGFAEKSTPYSVLTKLK